MSSGFVAGTLVHMDKGLIRIHNLQVGDLVLSKAKNGHGKSEYKPVINTFKSTEKQKIVKVAYTSQFARERDENALSYLLCTGNHPFWVNNNNSYDINDNLLGKWTVAESLAYGNRHLVSATSDTLIIDEYACLPVRKLPNFPERCAYTQQIFDRHFWQYDRGYLDVHFINFTDHGYEYISYAGATEEGRKKFDDRWHKWQGCQKEADVAFELNEHEPITINPFLFEKLKFRMHQDASIYNRTKEALQKGINSGDIFYFNREDELNGFKMIDELGDATGLKRGSIHFSMRRYDDDCPNPYEDYVYNIEVADYHSYFVGHDGVLVGDLTIQGTSE